MATTTAIYFSAFAFGVLVCWIISKLLPPKYWFVFIGVALVGYIVHGFILDPLVGYPPWQKYDLAGSIENVDLHERAISWFSFSLTIAGAIFAALTFRRNAISNNSDKANAGD